jgi:hypothetical protein
VQRLGVEAQYGRLGGDERAAERPLVSHLVQRLQEQVLGFVHNRPDVILHLFQLQAGEGENVGSSSFFVLGFIHAGLDVVLQMF